MSHQQCLADEEEGLPRKEQGPSNAPLLDGGGKAALPGEARRERWYENRTVQDVFVVAGLAICYMAVSSGLITFNKFLMHPGRFPYATSIGLLHMSCCFSFNCVLFLLCPSLYPSLTDPAQKLEIDREFIFRILMPIGACFAAQLVLSNIAYLHSSVAFLQMMKQSNVVLVYFFSLALSLEQFCWRRCSVLLFIVGATALTIDGEVHFSFFGFTLQGASMLCEGLKLTLQSYSLSAAGRRLDALTYVMLVSPVVLAVLSVTTLGLELGCPGCPEALQLPPWRVVVEYKWLLLANGALAFTMNVVHALFIKKSSAITFILTGVVMKDVVIVSVAAMVLGEMLSSMQVAGFVMQLVGIFLWSMLKLAPQLCPDAADPTETSAQWEAVESEGSDNSGAGVKCRQRSDGGDCLSKASSESTMAPGDDEESQSSSESS